MANQRTDTQSVINLVINGKQAMTSLKELTDTQRKLNSEIRNMKPGDPGYKKQLQEVQMVNKALDEQKRAVKGLTTDTSKLATGWKDIAGGLAAGFGIGMGIGLLKDFGMQVFETTAKFQKLEAVLTTTIGSNSEAKLVMSQIQQFAAETPFQVDELTASYVKLANQGFKPNMEQMRKLGDLSASTGKGFDMLTEAIIDAQTGEFERLKEFGIRAEKNGDKVMFAFKGISKEVDFTSDSIRNYITELGDAEGISGSMAGISQTLAGKVSNLGDSWDSLLKTIGGQNSGMFNSVIDGIGNAINKIGDFQKAMAVAEKYNYKEASFTNRFVSSYLNPFTKTNGADKNVLKMSKKSNDIDAQIGSANSYSKVNEILKDLRGQQRQLNRETNEGAAYYSLFADKMKMALERAKTIGDDRKKESLISQSDQAKKAAKEQEKIDKENASRAKQAEKKEIAETKKFNEEIEKLKDENRLAGMSEEDAELEAVDLKYQRLLDKAKGNADATLTIETRMANAKRIVYDKIAQKAVDDDEKKTADDKKAKDEEFKRVLEDQKILEENAKNGLANGYANDLNGVSTEEQAAQLKEAYQQRERENTEQHLLALKMLYEAYGQDATEIDTRLSEIRLSNAEREAQGKIAWTQAKQEIDSAYLDAAQQGTQALMGLVNQQSMAYKGLLILDKAMAITKIILSTQTEIAGYYAANALLGPVGMGIASGQALAAKIRAGVSIGIVAATGIAELASSGDAHADGVRNATSGKKLVGEAGNEIIESDGKWWLTDGPQIVDFKGGENVYNASDTSKMLGDRMYQKNTYSLNSSGARDGEMNYRSNSSGKKNSASVNSNNGEIKELTSMVGSLIQAVAASEAKNVVFDYAVYEDYTNKLKFAREQQGG